MLNFIRNGGKLATFGDKGLTQSQQSQQSLDWHQIYQHAWGFVQSYYDYFAIDSFLYVHAVYYLLDSDYPFTIPEFDTLSGLGWAETQTSEFPDLYTDTDMPIWEDKFGGSWPLDAPPGVTVYAPGPGGEITHIFRSIHPETSILEGFPIGVKTTVDDVYGHHETYAFGLDPCFMQVADSRELIGNLLGLEPCCGTYTSGLTGNANFDFEGRRDIADIVKLIDRVYLTKAPLCCEENGNVNGDAENKINLADIVRLIDHVYISKDETAACE